jgi:transketolase
VEAGEKNPSVMVLCCDLTESTRSQAFAERFPDRFVEIGVAEQNMAGIAAGLSFTGKVPFIASYAVFSPGRNWDQIRVSIAYSNANVKIAGAHAGISVGPDGATHQALEDLAITRALPNVVVLCPTDAEETRKAVHAAAEHVGPVYLRFGREKVPDVTTVSSPFVIGKARVLRPGADASVVACGALVHEALVAADLLGQEGVDIEVIASPSVKPLDVETIAASARKTRAVVTAEEHQIAGGLGSAVAEALAGRVPVPIIRVGVHDTFGESGTPDELLTKYGMRATDIAAAVRRARQLVP